MFDAFFSEFSSLHPLMVHFPVALLLLAPVMQGVSLIRGGPDWLSAAAFCSFAGFVTAVLASRIFHAEPIDASPQAKQIFRLHEQYASFLLWAAGLAVFLKTVALILPSRRRMILEVLAFSVMMAAAAVVSVTGHLGAQLTHVHRVQSE